tara:strand:+ start:397 stop:726 length:330 start_codon:yes stop_codon:yes gene_type:complete
LNYSKKLLLLLFLLNSCVETTALLGPAVTVGSTGNIYQAGLTYGTNKTVLATTGKYPSEHLTNILKKTKESIEIATKYKNEYTNLLIDKKNNLEEEFISTVKKYVKEGK